VYCRGASSTDCYIPKEKNPQQLIVWGAISETGAGPLIELKGNVTSLAYVAALSRSGVKPWYDQKCAEFGSPMLFEYDLAPAHRTDFSKTALWSLGMHLLPAAPSSPEIVPIEFMWSEVEKHICRRIRPQNRTELRSAVHQAWSAVVTPELCHAMYARCAKVVAAVHQHNGSNQFEWKSL